MPRIARRQRPFFHAGLALLATALLGAVPVVTPRPPGAAALTLAPPRAPGYWLVGGDGSVYPFGSAGDLGSLRSTPLTRPVTGTAPTPSGNGYWLVASDGGIFSVGDAKFHGSTGDVKLNQPIVGMAATPTGNGYWFVASDGGIFSFGDAAFHGSTGDMKLSKPIVGMAASQSGQGYWFVAADGGIFNFGDAKFEGSAGGQALPAGIVVMAGAPGGPGTAPGSAPTGPTPTTTGPTTVTTGPAPTGEAFQMALAGDTGYSSAQLPIWDRVVGHMNSFPLSFVVHDGDFKDNVSPCSDKRFGDAKASFDRSAAPFVYTPGDNEWADCALNPNDANDPMNPRGRLAKLRELFFAQDVSLGQTRMPLTTQRPAGYPENTRWAKEGVVFATLNAPGADDNFSRDPDESNARRQANVQWLQETFDEAQHAQAAAVMIVWQANVWQPGRDFAGTRHRQIWKYLVDELRARTIAFGKPVVLVHGDTHLFRIDKGGWPDSNGAMVDAWDDVPNFTRVETYAAGQFSATVPGQPDKWLRVTVDPKAPQVFTFHPETAPPA